MILELVSSFLSIQLKNFMTGAYLVFAILRDSLIFMFFPLLIFLDLLSGPHEQQLPLQSFNPSWLSTLPHR